MRIYLTQTGCRLNYAEIERMAHDLRAAGHAIVDSPEAAQVIVFNSCAVTADAVRGSRKSTRQLYTANPHARIVVTGCWATLARDEAAALPGVTLVADNDTKPVIPLLLQPWSADFDDPADLLRTEPDGTPFDFAPAATRRNRTRTFLKVQDGCNNRCTFCIVTVARGESRSAPIADLVVEARRQVETGVQEIVLTGVHLGSYGRDLPGSAKTDLRELVTVLLRDTSVTRLRLSSLEPWEIAPGFFDLWAEHSDRLCPHLHLPLQAGTDKQLRAMARRCTTASFRQLVAEARAAIPNLSITTDLIAGFPGESDEDFLRGAEFVREMRFASAHIFPYSKRAGTAAATFREEPPGDVKRARARHLQEIVATTGAAERARYAGTRRPVLWEGEGKPIAESGLAVSGLAEWEGFTDNYLRVRTVAPLGVDLHNTITSVQLSLGEGDVMMAESALPMAHRIAVL